MHTNRRIAMSVVWAKTTNKDGFTDMIESLEAMVWDMQYMRNADRWMTEWEDTEREGMTDSEISEWEMTEWETERDYFSNRREY